MSDGPNGVGEWVIFCAALTGLGIIGLMILTIGIIAITLLWQLVVDIIKYGL